jgi:hypothetical protein
MTAVDQALNQGNPSFDLSAASLTGLPPVVDTTRYLTSGDIPAFLALAKECCIEKGPDFYGWKNPPQLKDGKLVQSQGWGASAHDVEVTAQEALDIYQAKLDGAYGERFMLTAGYIAAAVKAGQQVALLQMREEPGLPFDAGGWIVASVNGYPMFHIAPTDLPMAKVAELGLITLVTPNTVEAETHKWKGTNKVQEFGLLLDYLS